MAVSFLISPFPFLFFFLFLSALTLPSPSSNRPQTFIVHVSKSHKPSLFSSHHQWYTSILQSLPSSPHHPSRLLYTYNKAINGFSAHLTPLQASSLRQHRGILSVILDQPRHLHTTRTPHFLGLSDDFGLWPYSNFADDVIIGVLDTGIWPERDSFSDSFLSNVPERFKGICETSKDFPVSACNKKIIGARAFY